MDWSQLWSRFVAGEADAVEALSTLAAVVVAIVAAGFVWWQIREGRRVSVEQAQPDVVALMESNPNQPQMIEIAFRNFGPTPARNVTISSDVPIQRWMGQGTEDVWLPPSIPYLAPGQEWRTTWDYAPRRMESPLKDVNKHTVTVGFDGLPKTSRRTSVAVLDWGAYKGRRYLDQKSTHDAAKALVAIAGIVKKWSEHGKALSVVSRDGDKVDAAERAEIEEYRARMEADAAGPDAVADHSNDTPTAPPN